MRRTAATALTFEVRKVNLKHGKVRSRLGSGKYLTHQASSDREEENRLRLERRWRTEGLVGSVVRNQRF